MKDRDKYIMSLLNKDIKDLTPKEQLELNNHYYYMCGGE